VFKSILVAVDGSPSAQRAVEIATDLAAKYDASIDFVHVGVVHKIPEEIAQLGKIEHIGAAPRDILLFLWGRIVEDAQTHAREHGLKKVSGAVLEGDPASNIVDYAAKKRVDAIVMGCRGLGDVKGLLLGSVSHKVTSLAPCTCITVH